MWNRTCPLCFVRVPRVVVLTQGEDLKCGSCHAALEISRPSRVFGALVGLAVALAVAKGTWGAVVAVRWILPIVAAVVGYGVGSAASLYFFSDLVVQPKAPVGHFPHGYR